MFKAVHAAAAPVKYVDHAAAKAGSAFKTGEPPVAPKDTVPSAAIVGAVKDTDVEPTAVSVAPESARDVVEVMDKELAVNEYVPVHVCVVLRLVICQTANGVDHTKPVAKGAETP